MTFCGRSTSTPFNNWKSRTISLLPPPPAEEAETTASQGKMDYQRQKERESIRQAEKKVKILEARIADLEQKFTDSDDPSDNHIPYIVSCELKEGWLSGEKPTRNWKKQKSNIILSINPSNR